MTASGMKVLVVDDERALLRAVAMNMTARGYAVTEADSGTAALSAAATGEHDLIVLDLGLPDISGLDVIAAIRRYAKTPIIVLSARTGSADKVTALDLGADDYVTKPFSMDELLARVRATTRRAHASDASPTVEMGAFTIDLAATTVTGEDGERVHLTPTEWHLLAALVRRPGRLVSSRSLLTEVRGTPDHTDPSYLRIYMGQLRRKLEANPGRPRHLITEPGMGYRFQP